MRPTGRGGTRKSSAPRRTRPAAGGDDEEPGAAAAARARAPGPRRARRGSGRQQDVAGPEPLEGRADLVRLPAAAAGLVELGDQRRGTRRRRRRGRRPVPGGGPAARGLRSSWRSSDDHVPVGLVLGERQVEEMVGLVGRVAPHQVDGHVVGGPERRGERVGAARRQPGDLVEGHERAPAHRPRSRRRRCRAARPGRSSCVYSPGVRSSWRSPVNFVSFSITTDRAGMLMPERERLGGVHDLDEPGRERLLDRFLHRRDQPGVVRGDARLEAGEPRVVRRARRGRRRRGPRGATSAMRRIWRRSVAAR